MNPIWQNLTRWGPQQPDNFQFFTTKEEKYVYLAKGYEWHDVQGGEEKK